MAPSGETVDVFLSGSKDKSPQVQLRLASLIAARYRLSAPMVAEALDGIPCRVAERLSRREAEALIDALDKMGAQARWTASGTPLPPGTPAAPAAWTPRRASPAPPDELLSPPVKDGRITLKSAEAETPLVVDVAEPIDFAEPGPDGKTGVRGANIVRCTIHGLAYNRRKASGCIRCLAAARARVRRIEDGSPRHAGGDPGASGGARWRQDPFRRAFLGLALALGLGFVPAAGYARAINHRALIALRSRQAVLSASPATPQSLAAFDALDATIESVHRRGARQTLLIWLVAGGLAAAVWTRLSRAVQ